MSNASLPLQTSNEFYIAICCSVTVLVLFILGTIGNLLSILVFSQPHFRRLSINVLLLALSIADLTMLILVLPVTFPSPLIDFLPSLQPVYAVAVTSTFPIACMAQCASVWLLVIITIERWAAVCRPLRVNRDFTRKRALILILLISIFSVCYNVVRIFEFELDGFELHVTSLRVNADYVLWKLTVADLTLTYFIPLLILIILNTRVVVKIHQSRKLRRISAAQRGERRTTRMLVYVVIMFVTCYTPTLILNLMEVINPNIYDSSFGYFASDINNILAATNSATTWLFYLRFSTRYRDAVICMMNRLLCRKVTPRVTHSVTCCTSATPLEVRMQRRRSSAVDSVVSKLGVVVPQQRRHSSQPEFEVINIVLPRSDNEKLTENSALLKHSFL